MIGPGLMRSTAQAAALIATELNLKPGKRMGWLVPCDKPDLVQAMYAIGARNCELSLVQCRGNWHNTKGIVMPTFMPETG